MTSRTFTSTLNVEGNAKDRLREITQGSRALANVSSVTSTRLQKLGSDLNLATKAQSTGVGITSVARATGDLNLKVEKLSPALRELADRGLAIAEQATQKYNAAVRAGGPDSAAFRGEMRKNAVETRQFALRLDELSRRGVITGASLGSLAANFRQIPRGNELAQGFQGIASTLGNMSAQMKTFERRSREGMSTANAGTNNLTGSQLGAVQSAERLSQELTRVSQSGSMSATTLTRLANRADAISRQAAPALSSQLRGMSAEMRRLSIDAQMTEQQFKKTGSQFQFMEDVSKGTQKRFRQVSAASQGLMLSMGALSGNLQSLAFSLIFLQFSGAIKLSLAFAGLSAAAMVATKGVRKFLDNRKEMKILADTISVVTRNTKGFLVVTQRAEAITKKLVSGGLISEDQSEDFIKGLEISMVELRRRGIEPTADMLSIFSNVFAIQRTRGKNFDDSVKESMSSVLNFADTLDKSEISFEDFEKSFDDISKEGAAAMQILGGTVRFELDEVEAMLKETGRWHFLDKNVRQAVEDAEGEFSNLPPAMAELLESDIVQQLGKDALDPFRIEIGELVELAKTAFEIDIPASMKLGADLAEEEANRMAEALKVLEKPTSDAKQGVIDLKNAWKQTIDDIHAMEAASQFTALSQGTLTTSSGRSIDPEYNYMQGQNVQRKVESYVAPTEYNDPEAWDVRSIEGTNNASDTKIEVTVNGNFQGSPQANGQAIAGSIKALWGMNSTGYQPRI